MRVGKAPKVALTFAPDGFMRQMVEIGLDSVEAEDGEIQLVIERLSPISLADAGEGGDERQPGVFVRTLGLVWG